MHDKLFEAALGIAAPWFVAGVQFDEKTKVLTVGIDFAVELERDDGVGFIQRLRGDLDDDVVLVQAAGAEGALFGVAEDRRGVGVG